MRLLTLSFFENNFRISLKKLKGDTHMSTTSRRRFLKQASTAGVACSASLLFGRSLSARAASEPIRIYVDSRRTISPIDRNLFGSFLEHLGRAIYEGISDPGSKLSDSNGFRKDVMDEIRHLGVPIIRYPGGNFVSGYNWLDGVGPKQDRPRVLDKAWNSLNTNQFGTNGLKAEDAARQMRYVDPSLQLIACGSSGPGVPTYLEWDREVLEQCYDYVDALSLHRYIGNTKEETREDSSKFLAMNLSMEKQIAETVAVCDLVRGHKRSPKKLWLSFDEWNVWYRARHGDARNGHGQEAPHLLEEIYNLEDALLVGGILNSLIRHADRVKLACLAQLINVIAPIMTNPNGLFRQTIYYPYSWALQFARGSVLNLLVESPGYEVAGMGQVPYLDVAGTISADDGKVSLFVLNRDLSKAHAIEVNWQDKAPARTLSSVLLTGDDLKAFNSFDAPQKVAPRTLDKPSITGGRAKFEVPARSYAVIQWGG